VSLEALVRDGPSENIGFYCSPRPQNVSGSRGSVTSVGGRTALDK